MVLGYAFALINYTFYGLGRFMKKKSAILVFSILSLLAAAISCYFFNSLSGYYLLLTQIIVTTIAYIKEKKYFTKFLTYAIYILAQLFITAAIMYTFKGLSSILCYISVSIAIFSIWWLNEQQMRIAGIFICLFSFLYNMTICNYLGVLELVIILTNVISYCIYKKKNLAITKGDIT